MSLTENDRFFLEQSEAAKRQSHDPDRQVGVVIVGRSGHVLATGSNSPPLELGLSPEQSQKFIGEDPVWKYYMLEHAERNAIRNARASGYDINGATMYGTLFPCADCARAIVTAGVKRLVVPGPHLDLERDHKWTAQYNYAQKILELARIQLDLIDKQPSDS